VAVEYNFSKLKNELDKPVPEGDLLRIRMILDLARECGLTLAAETMTFSWFVRK